MSELLPLQQARARMLSAVQAVAESEVVALPDLPGRILAADLVASDAVPPSDNSAMDGYALRSTDLAETAAFRVVGQALAGQPFTGVLAPGECVLITTGAIIPDGADTVVVKELAQVDGVAGDAIELPTVRFAERLYREQQAGQNIRRAGEDIAPGQKLIAAGHRCGPIDPGLLASVGRREARVKRVLKVALCATGSELITPGEPLAPGQIYESNRYFLTAMLQRLGVCVIDLGVVPDHPQLLRQAFVRGAAEADALIVTGGASVGEADYTRALLAELGAVDFWKVAIKPGKPFLFGTLQQAVFFGLPGNPVSALVTFHQLVVPTLQKMQGATAIAPLILSATTTVAMTPNRLRLDLQRGWLQAGENGLPVVTPDPQQGSGVLSAMSRSNCFILLEPGDQVVAAGTIVSVLPFDELLK